MGAEEYYLPSFTSRKERNPVLPGAKLWNILAGLGYMPPPLWPRVTGTDCSPFQDTMIGRLWWERAAPQISVLLP